MSDYVVGRAVPASGCPKGPETDVRRTIAALAPVRRPDVARADERIEELEAEIDRLTRERDEARAALEAMRAAAAAHLDEPTRTSGSALYDLVERPAPGGA